MGQVFDVKLHQKSMRTNRIDRCEPRYAGTEFTNRDHANQWWHILLVNYHSSFGLNELSPNCAAATATVRIADSLHENTQCQQRRKFFFTRTHECRGLEFAYGDFTWVDQLNSSASPDISMLPPIYAQSKGFSNMVFEQRTANGICLLMFTSELTRCSNLFKCSQYQSMATTTYDHL